MLLVQVSCQLDGQEEVQNIEMMTRSSEGELGDRVRAKRTRSVQRENVGEMKKVSRVMSEGRYMVAVEKPGIVAEKTTIQGVGEVEAGEVRQGTIFKRSLGGECGDRQHQAGGEGSAGAVVKPVTRLLPKTTNDPRKAVVASSAVRGARSQTAPGRQPPRVEKTGREGIFQTLCS